LTIEGELYRPESVPLDIFASFKIVPTAVPKSIDFRPTSGPLEGEPLKGIYRCEGSEFTICRSLDAGAERPTGFAAPEDSRRLLVVWRRESARDLGTEPYHEPISRPTASFEELRRPIA